jgi:hypothetical protein
MNNYVEQRSARSALISSGIVGGMTAVLVKGLKQPLEVSLPIAVAGAIALDYWTSTTEIKATIRDARWTYRDIAKQILEEYREEEIAHALSESEKIAINAYYDREQDKIDLDSIPQPEESYVTQALTAGWLTLSFLGYAAVIGASELLFVRLYSSGQVKSVALYRAWPAPSLQPKLASGPRS